MGKRMKNVMAVFSDTRARAIVILLFVIALIAFVVGYVHFKRASVQGPATGAALPGGPTTIRSVPGVGDASREYVKLQEQQNIQQAQQALKAKTAAVPTLTRITYVDSGASLGDEAASKGGCSVAELKRARAAGVTAFELRCRGCSLAALKAAGYTAGELKAAGFTAKELKDAGFSAKDLRDAGFSAAELKAAGFSAKDLAAAGFNAAELKAAGFSDQDLKKSGAAALTAIAKPTKKDCSVEHLRKLHAQKISSQAIKALGCSAAAFKAAGFTAAELKAAGFSAKDLRNAGFTAKQLKDAGFSAKELKDAGFTAGELKAAGFSAKDLKDAGFSAKQLKDAGFSAAELKDAGSSAKDLKDADFTDGDLLRAGFAKSKIGLPTEKKPEKEALPTQPEAKVPAVAKKPTVTGKVPFTAAVPTAEETPTWQKQLEELRKQQEQQMSAQEYQDQVKQAQQTMSSQASDLFSSWVPIPTQQYAVGEADKSAGATTAGSATGQTAGGKTLANAKIFKAGTILFAVLDTSINSDEQSPIMATIVQGKLKGSKILGSFQRQDKKVVLQFNLISIPHLKKSMPINAVAIDQNTARTALSTSVNSHYMLRYGTLFASSFASGLGQAIQTAGSSSKITQNGTQENFFPKLNAGEKSLVALGNVGQQFGNVLSPMFNIPPTVRVKSGSGIGILIMADLAVPKGK